MADFVSAIAMVESGHELAAELMAELVERLLSGAVEPDSGEFEQVRHLLIALSERGETVSELVGAARAMRARMTPIRRGIEGEPLRDILLDTCGTGGSRTGTFNISTATAIVVSACGVAVAKHGNRKATSHSGSADVLAELGVAIECDRETVEQSLRELKLCFCFAPKLHPAMRHVAAIRKSIPVPTMFNLLGPLCNPAGATHQLLGTPRESKQQVIAAALSQLGTQRSLVVRGEDGQDEVSLAGKTFVIEVRSDGTRHTHEWTAVDFGLQPAGIEALQAKDPQHSATIIRHVLAGERGPHRDAVVANAAAALWLVGHVESPFAGARLAEKSLDAGTAAAQLARFAAFGASRREV